MNWLKRFFDFYINSSIHVSLANTALVYLTFLKLNYTDAYTYMLFAFFATVVGYNFVKYLEVSNLYYRKLTRSMRSIQLFTVGCSIGMLYFFLQLPYRLFWLLLPFGLFTVLYAIPLFPKDRNLRSIASGKIFIIAMVWTGVSVMVPAYYVTNTVSFDLMIESVQRFLFVLVLMFPFEIRDLPFDHQTLKTIPQLIGIKRTKVLGSVFLLLFMILGRFKNHLQNFEIVSNVLISILLLIFLWCSKSKQAAFYSSFWVESIPILWVLIFIGLRILFV